MSSCFIDKILGAIPDILVDDFPLTGMRRLQSFGDNENKDAVIRENVIKDMGKEFFAKNKGFLDHLDMAIKVSSY